MVEIVHLAYGREPEDPAAIELVGRLRGASRDFTLWWDGYGLRRFVPTDVSLRHPAFGQLRLTYTGFVPSAMPSAHDWAVVLQPAAGAGTRARLAEAIRRASRVPERPAVPHLRYVRLFRRNHRRSRGAVERFARRAPRGHDPERMLEISRSISAESPARPQ
jgi:hypothetical protein